MTLRWNNYESCSGKMMSLLSPKYVNGHFHNDTHSSQSPNAAIHVFVDKNALPTCYPYDRNIWNDFHTIQAQSSSPALFNPNIIVNQIGHYKLLPKKV